MENKDTYTDYQKVVRVGKQKWENVETTFGIMFLFEIRIHYFSYREFSGPITQGAVRIMSVPFFIADFNLLSCRLDNFTF